MGGIGVERESEIKKVVLDNGLSVVLREMHHAPVTSFWVWYRVGSRNEGTGITGISHWVEHMLFKGTPDYPKGEFDKAVAREGGHFNGMTWIDFTTFFETLPSDRIDLALRVEADRMQNATISPEETEIERTVIISERQGDENDPEFLLTEALQAAAFQAHSYRHPVIGWQSDLEAMTRDQLYGYYRAFYAPNHAVVAVAGDFKTAEMLERIETLFGAIPPGPERPAVTTGEPPQRGERRVTVEGPGTTSYVEIAFQAPRATDPDYYPVMVLDSILGGAKPMTLWGGGAGNRSSRLYKALVESELAASVSCNMSATVDPYLLSFSATVRDGQTHAGVEEALLSEIERVMQQPVEPSELAKAIKQTRAQFAYSSETVTDQAFWLGYSEVVADVHWFEGFLDRLSAVTVDDVQRVAREYLPRTRRNVGWYAPNDSAPQGCGSASPESEEE
jgi:zinc protease